MGLPQFELLSGTLDGVNLTFFTSQPYTAGSLAIYLNGQLLFNPGGNPWTETNPATGEVTLAIECTPRAYDVVSGFYLDTTTDFIGDVVEALRGFLCQVSEIYGEIDTPTALGGFVSPTTYISGTLSNVDTLQGTLVQQNELLGVLRAD